MLLFSLLSPAVPVSAQTLVIGFGTHKPPYVFEQEHRGLEVEIVIAALEQTGLQVEPYYSPLERMHMMLERQELDGITVTSEASGVSAHYSDVYITYQNVAVTLKARNIRLSRISDLSQYSVSAFQRARLLLGDEFRTMALNNSLYREEARQVTRNLLLYAGRIDVMIGDRRIIRAFTDEVADRVDTTQEIEIHPLFEPTAYRMGFVDADLRDQFNSGLQQIRENGRYQEIEARYAAY